MSDEYQERCMHCDLTPVQLFALRAKGKKCIGGDSSCPLICFDCKKMKLDLKKKKCHKEIYCPLTVMVATSNSDEVFKEFFPERDIDISAAVTQPLPLNPIATQPIPNVIGFREEFKDTDSALLLSALQELEGDFTQKP